MLKIQTSDCIFNWVEQLESDRIRTLPLFLSFEDAEPAHLPIFTGVVRTSLERYRSMAEHTWSIAFPAAVFGPDIVENVSYDPITKGTDFLRAPPVLSLVPENSFSSASSMSSRSSLVGPVRSSASMSASSQASQPCK